MLCFSLILLGGYGATAQSVAELYSKTGIQSLVFSHDPPGDTIIDISAYAYCFKGNLEEADFINKFKEVHPKPFAVFRQTFKESPTLNHFTLLFAVNNRTLNTINLYFQCGSPGLLKAVNTGLKNFKYLTAGFTGNNELSEKFTPTDFAPLVIPGETINYYAVELKYIGSYRKSVTPRFFAEKSFHKATLDAALKTRPQIVFHILILGGILVLSLFMLAQFFLNKDKAYLYYALYGLAIFLFFEKIFEINCNIRLISQWFHTYVYYAHIPLQLLVCYFYIAFLKTILNISIKQKFFYWYCNTMMVTITGIIILYMAVFLPFRDYHPFISVFHVLCTLISALAIFPILLLLLLKPGKDKTVWYILVGFCFLTLSALVVIFLNRTGKSIYFKVLPPVTFMETGALIEIIFFGLALGYKTFITKTEKERIEYQKQESEMAALKAQMNPHFIFNCINSIDALIQSNDKYNATLYLNKFAKLIRSILDSSKQNMVSFSKDIETLKLYIELEQLRNENKFTSQLDIDEELMNSDCKVPPLIIQPFVENAIIHGLRNKEGNDGRLIIAISKTDQHIIYSVTDNGIGRQSSQKINAGKEKSYGIQMSYDRIKLFNKEDQSSVTINDLYDNEKIAGTRVIVNLKMV